MPKETATKAADSAKLSTETMKMKFMQRNKTQDTNMNKEELNENKACPTDITLGTIEDRRHQRWRMSIKLPSKSTVGLLGLTVTKVEPMTKYHVLSRRSFGRFNVVIENAYEDSLDVPSFQKKEPRVERDSNLESQKVNVYAQRASKDASDKAQKRTKPNTSRISGNGNNKRKGSH